MLPKSIRYFLNFFDIFGFSSDSSRLCSQRDRIFLIKLVHAIIIVLIGTCTFEHFLEFRSFYGVITATNQFMLYFFALFTYCLIIFDASIHQQSHTSFWTDVQLIGKDISCQSKFTLWTYTMKFIEFMSISFAITLTLFLTYDYGHIFVIIAHIILIRMLHIRAFYYLFCVEVIHFQLKSIRNELQSNQNKSIACNYNCLHSNQTRVCYDLKRLKWARQYYYRIFELIVSCNQIFGWSHFGVIFCCFYLLLTDIDWTYIVYISEPPDKLICKPFYAYFFRFICLFQI